MYVMAPAVLVLIASTGLFLFFDDGNTVLSSFNPFTALYSPQATPAAVEKTAPTANTSAELPAKDKPLSEETGN